MLHLCCNGMLVTVFRARSAGNFFLLALNNHASLYLFLECTYFTRATAEVRDGGRWFPKLIFVCVCVVSRVRISLLKVSVFSEL